MDRMQRGRYDSYVFTQKDFLVSMCILFDWSNIFHFWNVMEKNHWLQLSDVFKLTHFWQYEIFLHLFLTFAFRQIETNLYLIYIWWKTGGPKIVKAVKMKLEVKAVFCVVCEIRDLCTWIKHTTLQAWNQQSVEKPRKLEQDWSGNLMTCNCSHSPCSHCHH